MSTVLVVFLSVLLTAAVPITMQGRQAHFDAEYTKTVLEDAGESLLSGGQKGSLILIARLGKGERTESLAKKRLAGLRAYLRDHPFLGNRDGFPPQRLVSALGESVSGLGRIEIYVEGKLIHVVLFKKGQQVDWSLG